MEPATRFNLSEATRVWRGELQQQGGLGEEAIRELQQHLIEAVDSLRHRGLNEQEAFMVARHRVGPAVPLGEEFCKADPADVTPLMRATILRWSGLTAAALSAFWVVLLAALVVRCMSIDQPFPVLAKLSPFHDHLMLTGRFLRLFPAFAIFAAVLLGAAWYFERSFRSVRATAVAIAVCVSLSLLVILVNPGGYLSWFLS